MIGPPSSHLKNRSAYRPSMAPYERCFFSCLRGSLYYPLPKGLPVCFRDLPELRPFKRVGLQRGRRAREMACASGLCALSVSPWRPKTHKQTHMKTYLLGCFRYPSGICGQISPHPFPEMDCLPKLVYRSRFLPSGRSSGTLPEPSGTRAFSYPKTNKAEE